MTLRELRKLTKDLPPDSLIVFRVNSKDKKTDHRVTGVLETASYDDLHYVVLGGYL